MTVSTTTSEARFVGNNITTVFPLGFEVQDAEDLVVQIVQLNGSVSPQTLNVGYTVSNTGLESGATITLPTPLETGTTLLVRRNTPRTQEAVFLPSAGFSPQAVEAALDRMALIVQEAGALLDRALRVSIAESIGDIPPIAQRSGKVLGFNVSGNPIAVEAIAQALVSSFMEAILLSTTATDARIGLFVPGYFRNASVFDFNAVGGGAGGTSTGIYTTNSSATNLPPGENGIGGHIIALNYNPDPNSGAQIYISPTGRMYRRGRTGGVFSGWVEISYVVETASIPTTGGTLSTPVTFPQGARKLEVFFTNVSLTGTGSPSVSFGTGGTLDGNGYSSSSVNFAAGVVGTPIGTTNGFIISVGDAARELSGCLTISLESGNTWQANGLFYYGGGHTIAGGRKTLAGSPDILRLSAGGNNFDGGSFRVRAYY